MANEKQKTPEIVGSVFRVSATFPEVGVTISDLNDNNDVTSSRHIVLREICNYNSNPFMGKQSFRFPSRSIEINLSPVEVNKLMNLQATKNSENSQNPYIDIDITMSSVNDEVGKMFPIEGGSFKALLQQSEITSKTMNYNDDETELDKNEDAFTVVTFILFKESELNFGSNININYIYNTNLMSMFTHAFCSSFPDLKLVVSKFGHNPVVKNFIVPRMGFDDFIDMLESEFGIFKTEYSLFLENGIVFFLNSDNNLNVNVSSMKYTINLDVRRNPGDVDNTATYTQSNVADETLLKPKLPESAIKIKTNSINLMKNDPITINASGNMQFDRNSSSRSVNTIRKITDIPRLPKEKHIKYELIKFNLERIGTTKISPLTKVVYIDNTNNVRNYNVCSKQVVVTSAVSTNCNILGYRVLHN